MLTFKSLFNWYLGSDRREKVMQRYETFGTSIKGVFEKHLAKRKRPGSLRPVGKQSKGVVEKD